MAKGKFYAVKVGNQPGIYTSWADCELQVKGFSGAKYKSFTNLEDAEEYLNGPVITETKEKLETEEQVALSKELSYIEDNIVIYTDGSNTQKGQRYSFGMVVLKNGVVIHEDFGEGDNPNAVSMRNVAGELLGAMKAALYTLKNSQAKKLIIFHDYEGVSAWVDGSWSAKNHLTKSYKDYMHSVMNHIEIEFIHVAGHSGNPYNDRADYLAKFALGLTKEQKRKQKQLEEIDGDIQNEKFSVKLEVLKNFMA